MQFAVKNALKTSYRGHFATVASHLERFGEFEKYIKNQNIRDTRYITQEHLINYGEYLKNIVDQGKMSVSYAQNLLSSVNVTLRIMREDRTIQVSPASSIGHRNNIKFEAPMSLNRDKILNFNPDTRSKAVFNACRELGMRKKEAVLMDYRLALKQAKETGKINISVSDHSPTSFQGLPE